LTDSEAKPPTPGEIVVVMVGTLSPMTTLAFSLLRTRMRGGQGVRVAVGLVGRDRSPTPR
jgi:hypothetical protein